MPAPRKADKRFLEWHGNKWRVVVSVPRDLHATIGKTKLKQSLETDSLAEANRLKWTVIDALQAQIRGARSPEDATAEALRLAALRKRITAYTDLSKSRVALECGIGESTVANMRRAKGQLRALGISAANMLDMSWRDAQAEAKGEQSSEIDRDAAIEKRARGYARSIAKTLKDRPHKDPEGFARALQMLDERLPARLLESEAWEDDLAEYFEAHQRDEADADY